MKKILKKIVISITIFLSKKIIRKYRPKIIAVTGSVGKTSTKDAIFEAVKSIDKTAKSNDSLNTELGLPLAIAGFKGGVNISFSYWVKVIKKLIKILFFDKDFYKILVLEMGADKPGDLDLLLKTAPPDIGIITSVKSSHLKFFKSKSQIIKEKRKVIEALKEDGIAVLCGDDKDVLKMANKTKAKVVTYGLLKENTVLAKNVSYVCDASKINQNSSCSISFKLHYNNNFIPVNINNIFGKSQLYAVLAASAVAISFEKNLIEVADIIKSFKSPKGRLNVLKGIEKSLILDDSYNASTPVAIMVALEALKEIKAKKKIAVIGDMLELGKKEVALHKKIGKDIFDYADIVFTFGKASRNITREAKKNKKYKNKIAYHFQSKRTLIKNLKDLLEFKVAVLVKGSQGMRMEQIIKEILFDKKKARKLLVRQTEEWLKK